MSSLLNYPDNFLWSGVHSGVKKTGKLDLGLVYSSFPSTVAAVFTENKLAAAPVIQAREKLQSSNKFHALLVNSGVANAATGPAGRRDNEKMIAESARLLNLSPDEVLSASTGYIGRRLALDKITGSLPEAVDSLDRTPDEFSRAIQTTDTSQKLVQIPVDGLDATICGVAKGSGMINPSMATMLAFLFLDWPVDAGWWQAELKSAADTSFNQITVDGDTSTNDTVMAWAADLPDRDRITASHPAAENISRALKRACAELAKAIVVDGEGATCTIEVRVTGAASSAEAEKVAAEIAGSPLVRTAFHARKPNWGRIYSAVGAARVELAPDKFSLSINGQTVFSDGRPQEFDKSLQVSLKEQDEHTVDVDLAVGNASARKLTCDLSQEYVRINVGYN